MAIEPTDTPSPTPSETPAPSPAPKSNHLLETPKDSPDPDELELQEAIAAAEAETKGTLSEEDPPATPSPAPTEGAAPSPSPSPAPSHTVPVAAVQAERAARQQAEAKAREAENQAAYYKGVAEGRLPSPHRTDTPAPSTPSRKQEIRAEMRDLAKQVDAGSLSVEEYETKRQELDDEREEISRQQTLAAVKAEMPKASNDLYLSTMTGRLEQENPWLQGVPDDELKNLVPFAEKALKLAGYDLEGNRGTPEADYRLREALIAKAKSFGFDRQYGGAPAPSPSPTPAPSGVPTEAQRKAKEDLAAAAPGRPQGTSAPSGTWTEDRVEAMSDLDLENMPLSELKKVGDAVDRDVAARRVSTPTNRGR